MTFDFNLTNKNAKVRLATKIGNEIIDLCETANDRKEIMKYIEKYLAFTESVSKDEQ